MDVAFHSALRIGLPPRVIVKSVLTLAFTGQSLQAFVPEHAVMVSSATNLGEWVSSAISVTFIVPLRVSVPLVKLNVDVEGEEVGVKVIPPFELVTVSACNV